MKYIYLKMSRPLEYYFEDGTHVIFDKYVIDIYGVIRNSKTMQVLNTRKMGKYNVCSIIQDCGEKTRDIRICRAIASTFHGLPPTPKHTADHKNRNHDEDTMDNIQWLDKSGQNKNRDYPETYKSALIIEKNDIEKSAQEWGEHLKGQINPYGRDYTEDKIRYYAQKNIHGFSYKKYPDLQDEIWKEISWSNNTRGRWEISNMNRVKYITKFAENVLSGERLGLDKGYPTICINNTHWHCHILSFMTFFPDEYNMRRSNENILHEDDDKLDFRPHKLRLGTQSENTKDAYENGKYEGTKSERMKCASYIDDVFEKEHESQHDAVKYLKSIGYDKASRSGVRQALASYRDEKIIIRYGRTWRIC